MILSATSVSRAQLAGLLDSRSSTSKIMPPVAPDQRFTAKVSTTLSGTPAVMILALVLQVTGCASIGRRGAVPDELAACRELSRQGATAMEMGQWAQAESLLSRAVEASPNDSEAHHYLAETYWHRGAADAALEHIEEAVELDPSDAPLLVRAGEMRLTVGSVNRSLEYAEQAIRSDPKLATAWALRGRAFWRLGERDRALADLQRALQFAPENPDLLQDVAMLYRQQGQPARALAALHHLLDTYAPGEEPQLSLILEGQTLAELGRPSQAAESLAAAVRRGPPNAELFYQLAQAQSDAGDYSSASAAARQALVLDASHEPSRQLLARLASIAGPETLERR
jgi:tetratricopeptide (TPR) repeat protein